VASLPPLASGPRTGRILLTGATGYVGGRLLTLLASRGYAVRCLARRPEYLKSRASKGVKVLQGDVLDPASLAAALTGVDTAYYLVHALGEVSGFEEQEAEGARNFAAAARRAGVSRIIYLGGLGDEHQDLSPHLRSRHQVGRILRESGVPAIELRASIVIGSGSLSFEMIRALTEHLPLMVAPRWVSVLAQPIGVQDLLAYLVEAIDVPLEGSVVVEIGGADQLSYLALMQEYARQRGLTRIMIRVGLLTPRLSSLWLGLVTPLYARVGRKLIESIRHPTVVTSDAAQRLFTVKPVGASDAIRAALDNEDRESAETRWSDAVSAAGRTGPSPSRRPGARLTDRREVTIPATPAACFDVVANLGGQNGWPAHAWLWRLRGLLDLLVGGVGMRRGRPEGRALRVGDALDFWRVEACEPDRRLRLAAEMKLPGRAWLEFLVESAGEGSRLVQIATFDPVGLAGRAYWYGILPLHGLVFSGLLAGIAARVMARQPHRRRQL
jgi:uncharacterized protein YbjT (DUF2867 family)